MVGVWDRVGKEVGLILDDTVLVGLARTVYIHRK